MNSPFTRTPTGIVGKWRFYSIPTVWVEGPTDIFFFAPIVDDLPCRLEAIRGCKNAAALIEGLVRDDLPYVVILDGDYEILTKRRQIHKRVIRLRRYSFENYLWECEPMNRACHRCAQSGERTDAIGPEFDRVTQHLSATLRGIVEVDVAARRSDPAPKVLPDRVERLLVDSRKPDIDPGKVERIAGSVISLLEETILERARGDVATYLKTHRFVDLLKGHVLFGVLRLLFTRAASVIKGEKVLLDDDSLTQLLADSVWRRPPSKDHIALRSQVRKSVAAVLPLFEAAKD